jgi:hypothetical protein
MIIVFLPYSAVALSARADIWQKIAARSTLTLIGLKGHGASRSTMLESGGIISPPVC